MLKRCNINLLSKLHLTDLRGGWAPAILDKLGEVFAIEQDVIINNDTRYWVGGSTDADHGDYVSRDGYYTNRTGNHSVCQC